MGLRGHHRDDRHQDDRHRHRHHQEDRHQDDRHRRRHQDDYRHQDEYRHRDDQVQVRGHPCQAEEEWACRSQIAALAEEEWVCPWRMWEPPQGRPWPLAPKASDLPMAAEVPAHVGPEPAPWLQEPAPAQSVRAAGVDYRWTRPVASRELPEQALGLGLGPLAPEPLALRLQASQVQQQVRPLALVGLELRQVPVRLVLRLREPRRLSSAQPCWLALPFPQQPSLLRPSSSWQPSWAPQVEPHE